MIEFISSVWWLIVVLGVLVTFHEFGHYWVARRFGVRVLRFSVGFGRPLWSRMGRDGTEYVVAALPLGGYVKLLDSREHEVTEQERDQTMDSKHPAKKIAILLAGPAFNLIFAVLAFWLMFMVGIPQARPIIGDVDGLTAQAGVPANSEIIAVGDEPTSSWQYAHIALMAKALDREPVEITVRANGGIESRHLLELNTLPDQIDEEQALAEIGITPWRPDLPPIVGSVNPDTPAQRAGLESGDRIISIQTEPVEQWTDIGRLLQQFGRAGEPLDMVIDRDGFTMDVQVRPQMQKSGTFSKRLILGIVNQPPSEETMATWEQSRTVVRLGPLEGIPRAFNETWRLTTSTLGMLGRMLTGKASVKNLSGPITIAQFANDSASLGLSNFLFFMGLISLSLGILNLLPIPVLDGGHIVFYLIEWAKGSPVSEQFQVAGQYFGLMALAALMGLAFVNDILRLIG
ncbi:MAG TPA: RIP metalloprotease RseP [Xanthomonadales bacterium]|nr:RIP metalloprotease RseP [Xanthomonadales bacterium]